MNEQEQQLLLEIADDELILGWRDSEWTGIAPLLEEDVAFSSIAQNEIGHARALYELVARERGTTADELAFDRSPDEYRCAPIVELRLLDWGQTIARHYLYEEADAVRLERLKQSDDLGDRRARSEDRPRGGVPPHARPDVVRPPAGRVAFHRRARRAAASGSGPARLGPARRAHIGAGRALGRDDDGAALSTGRHEVVTEAQVWDALAEIPDPEIPVISLVDLGVVREVSVTADQVRVDFTPTFLGCPALEVMRDAMADQIRSLGGEPEINVCLDDSWSTDRITPEGREKLRASGFAPPSPREASPPTLVQLQSSAHRCPYCGSTETRLENIFGPTPCRSLRYCASCRQPFEQFKTI